MTDIVDQRPGDKVRIRSGPHAGSRGRVQASAGDIVSVMLPNGDLVDAGSGQITNYSLAARKAWRSMPKRAGRPRQTDHPKKMVSLRLDVDVWRGLARAAELGLISSREQAVNQWLKQHLTGLLDAPSASDSTPGASPHVVDMA